MGSPARTANLHAPVSSSLLQELDTGSAAPYLREESFRAERASVECTMADTTACKSGLQLRC